MDFGLTSYRPEKQKPTYKIQNIFLLINLLKKTRCSHTHIVSVSSAPLIYKPFAILIQVFKRNRNFKNT